MSKCIINEKKEITCFYDDLHPLREIPEDALDCDKIGKPLGKGIETSEGFDEIFFWKLENGKVLPTTAGEECVTQDYSRNRANDYPIIGDQLDMIYKDTKNSTTTHAAAVEAVKTKWPKNNTGPVE